MSNNETPLFRALVDISRTYDDMLKQLNRQSLNVFSSNGMASALEAMSRNTTSMVTGMSDMLPEAMRSAISNLEQSYANILSTPGMGYTLSDAMIKALSSIQTDAMLQLSRCVQTSMVKELTTCFAQAGYLALPRIITESISKPIIGASDVAFLKTAKLLPAIGEEIIYPYGFKASLSKLNAGTAEDLIDEGDITYDTQENYFETADSEAKSTEMNVICAGRAIFNVSAEEELFTETELMNFSSFLSRTPTLAMIDDVGMRIFQFIKELYESGEKQLNFDKECYYHSRNRSVAAAPYTADLMLKAPHGLPGTGRYNHAGRSHYYYADTKNGAENEVKKYLKKEEVTQTIRLIPIRPICLLDLSGTLQRGKIFLKFIRFSLSDAKDNTPREYLIPGFVADCCREIGFEGIKYYGSQEHNNYVSWDDGYFKDGGMC